MLSKPLLLLFQTQSVAKLREARPFKKILLRNAYPHNYHIRDRGSDLYVGIDMVKNYCLYKWYGRCSAKKGQKLSQIIPN